MTGVAGLSLLSIRVSVRLGVCAAFAIRGYGSRVSSGAVNVRCIQHNVLASGYIQASRFFNVFEFLC